LKLLVFDSHPVQYRVPVWQQFEKKYPGHLHVVYGSDSSVRGYADKDFGQNIAWDDPMLDGYEYTVLNCEKGPLGKRSSLTGEGVKETIDKIKPDVVLLVGLNYKYDIVAYYNAVLKGIPVWLRCETQDYAVHRSALKSPIRSLIYRMAYLKMNRIFYIGELNKKHYLDHGVAASILRPARYGTVDRFQSMSPDDKEQLRIKTRNQAGISPTSFVVGFSGKFIEKKNPQILFQMLEHLPESLRSRIHFYFMGSGKLEKELKELTSQTLQKYGVNAFFPGFINQSQLAGHYLAMDIMVLPSRRMGETWGLVANEAMQAGCGVIVSDAVGCGEDFKTWERFRVFKEPDPAALASAVTDLSKFPRDFNWAREKLQNYSIAATTESLANELKDLEKQSGQ
jgi:glycosyltransferase involved in cell wall biosynthesis